MGYDAIVDEVLRRVSEKLPEADRPAEKGKERRLDKRALTRRDLIEANTAGITQVRIGPDCMVTVMARETAQELHIRIVRGED